MLLTLTLPATSAPLLVALSALAAVCAFTVALTLLDTHERARREDADWQAWRASSDADLLYAYYLTPPPLSSRSAQLPTLPPCARVVASCAHNHAASRSQGQQDAWRGEMV